MRCEVKILLKEANRTAIFVTDDQQEALAVGDRVAIMNRGQLEQVDTPERAPHQPPVLWQSSWGLQTLFRESQRLKDYKLKWDSSSNLRLVPTGVR